MGYTFITGPMFSGKSTKLIDEVKKSLKNKFKLLIFNFEGDKRYSEKAYVSTHNKNIIESIPIHDAYQINNYLKNNNINKIFIDEIQFITNIYSWLVEMMNKYPFIEIVMSGLNYDMFRKYFNKDIEYILKCSNINKILLKSTCYLCSDIADYTQFKGFLNSENNKIIKNNILISESQDYYPVCLEHHIIEP